MAGSGMIDEFLCQRYPYAGMQQAAREALARACNSFVDSGLADSNFVSRLCSGNEGEFWSRLSEALLAQHLRKAGLDPRPSPGGGPDFLLLHEGRRVWIEVTCPEPMGVPRDFVDAPHHERLLRWTSAIEAKAEKLLGTPDGSVRGYLDKKFVTPEDAYVIAVNGRSLRSGPFPALLGVSRLPYAVEAALAVGPYQVMIDRTLRGQVDAWHQSRSEIPKASRKPVSTNTFLDPRYRPICAIWAGEDLQRRRAPKARMRATRGTCSALP